MVEQVEFLAKGAIPFALAACEKFTPYQVKGSYDEVNQVWTGSDRMWGLTLTLTAVPGGSDNDGD